MMFLNAFLFLHNARDMISDQSSVRPQHPLDVSWFPYVAIMMQTEFQYGTDPWRYSMADKNVSIQEAFKSVSWLSFEK